MNQKVKQQVILKYLLYGFYTHQKVDIGSFIKARIQIRIRIRSQTYGSGSGSDQKGPDPTGSGSATLVITNCFNKILSIVSTENFPDTFGDFMDGLKNS
jgi:hypothetical protein